MYYLSDPIYFESYFEQYAPIGSSLTYVVYMRMSGVKPSSLSPYNYEVIYRGHIYVAGGKQRIYLNDIIESQLSERDYFKPKLVGENDAPIEMGTSNPKCIVDVRFVLNDQSESQADYEEFLNIVQYYKDSRTPRGIDIQLNSASILGYNLLNQRTNVLPRIPLLPYSTNNFWLGCLFAGTKGFWDYSNLEGDPVYMIASKNENNQLPEDLPDLNYALYDSTDSVFSVNITGDKYSDLLSSSYNSTEVGIIPVDQQHYDDDFTTMQSYTPIAKVDECPADYYLIWMDRTGAYQCQPFTKKVRLKENIQTTNIINNVDQTRPVLKSVTDVWTVNSDWLTEEEYKAYESIFVSPYIYLFDTNLNEGYWVNITNNVWEEKTYKNNGKPFNLQLTLQSNRAQNIIY